MQTVDYRWSRRVCFSRSSTNCHSLLLISESWESLRVCLTQCLTHLRSQPKDANLVWWTLCDFIPKSPPSLFLAFQSHHRIASTVWARTLVQSCRKAFALRERGNRRAGVLFSVRGFFFFFLTCPCEGVGELATVNFQGNLTKSQVFHPCANSIVCVCFMRYRIHVFLSFVFGKKKKENYVSFKHVDPCLWLHRSQMSQLLLLTHPHSQTQRPLAISPVSKYLWHVSVYWYVAVCCSVIQHIWVFQVSLFPPLKPFFWWEMGERQLFTDNPACQHVCFTWTFLWWHLKFYSLSFWLKSLSSRSLRYPKIRVTHGYLHCAISCKL